MENKGMEDLDKDIAIVINNPKQSRKSYDKGIKLFSNSINNANKKNFKILG